MFLRVAQSPKLAAQKVPSSRRGFRGGPQPKTPDPLLNSLNQSVDKLNHKL